MVEVTLQFGLEYRGKVQKMYRPIIRTGTVIFLAILEYHSNF